MVGHTEAEDVLWESMLTFHHVGARNWTQVICPGCKFLYWVSHLAGPGGV